MLQQLVEYLDVDSATNNIVRMERLQLQVHSIAHEPD